MSADLKSGLEQEAYRRQISLAALLEVAARDLLEGASVESESEQERLHQAASACLGTIAGDDPRRAENARQTLRQRLRQRHER